MGRLYTELHKNVMQDNTCCNVRICHLNASITVDMNSKIAEGFEPFLEEAKGMLYLGSSSINLLLNLF
ncbi:hypothetical protein BGZ81_010789 [Podila clonocystis]|nr:hypothetical protein BGZ81_010789 [Podila clonocystis]